jgi:hypothetical protein
LDFGSTSRGAPGKTWSWYRTPPFLRSRVLGAGGVWLDKPGAER